MQKWFAVLFVLAAVATVLLASCAAPTPQVVEKTVVVPQVVPQTVVVPGATQVVQQTVVVPGTPRARPKLQVWIDHSFYSKGTDATFKAQVLEWAQQKGVDIEYQQAEPTVMTPRLEAALESKTLPDFLYTADERTVKMRRAGVLLDVSDLVKELDKNSGGFYPAAITSVTFDGKQVGIPMVMLAEEMYFRKDLLDKSGMKVPDTYEDLFAFAMKVHNPPTVWGCGMQIGTGGFDAEHQITSMLWAYGGSIWSADGKTIALDSPETRQVLALIKKYWDLGCWPQDAVTGDDAWNNSIYQTGKASFVYNTGSVAKWLFQNDQDLYKNTVFGPPPRGPKGRFANGLTESIVIPNTGKNIDLVKDLVRFLNDPARYQAVMVEMSGFRVPVYKGLKTMDMWKDRANAPLVEAADYTMPIGWPGPLTDAALEESAQKLMGAMVSRVLVDKWTADQAIAETVQKLKVIQERASK